MSVRGKAWYLLPLDLLLEMHPLHNKACCILFPQASDSERETEKERVCVCMDLKLMGFNSNCELILKLILKSISRNMSIRETFGHSLG